MAPAKRSGVVRARGPRGPRTRGAQSQGGPARSPEFKKKKLLQQKRTWRANTQKAFSGSVREGQGFAFQRKQKIQQEYKKLLKKEKKAKISQESQFTEKYPEHLKHLYLAEEEMLRKQDKKEKEQLPEEKSSVSMNPVATPRRNKKKTSNQKAKEEYEQVQAKRAAKKQEFEKRKQEREEAQQRYKKKKMEAYKILSKKTKKGQPNLNLQMEYLLKKIQEKN
ncbi:thyroid transcription factor 1-associated protein 26 isoform X1 [Gracilinanus agilis]|uniref:thyroid transcription factor 1-associated protein 26 isoform X1 n=1 Tax=Gracilinanus agilis TaxID=191870 RepID=UPI001CFE38CC|nr:thyroid transcription factor 1-associated protein 26 isoform X1 [Gracilinanus agilis]